MNIQHDESVKSAALGFASNPVEAGEKVVKHGVSKAGKLLSKAKEHVKPLYHKAVGGKGTGDYTVKSAGTTYKHTNVDSPGEHVKYAIHKASMDPKGTAIKAGAALATGTAGALALRAARKRRQRRQQEND